jgi:DNA polymerase III subunit gamma/tau
MLRFMAQNEDGSAGERYQVVARRFRPQTFQEMVGQEDVLRSLRSALQQKSVPHAFLFSGSRGVGKTTSARILARCLNCKNGPTPEPCGTCASCVSILDGSNPDVIEIDAASNNGIEDVRRLRETAGYATMQSRYRVIVLDEAHMLSRSAFNALLKTLEEPPKQVVFVLATTELDRVPETIRSRCQVLLFRRVGEDDLQKRLRMIADKEGVGVPDEVLAEIALTVRGGVRDAETALERILPVAREMAGSFDLETYRSLVARLGTDVLIDVAKALLAGDAKAGLHFAHEARQRGTDEAEALGELVEVLRWLMLLRIDGADSSLVPLTGALRERLAALLQGDGGATIDTARLDAMIAAGLKGRERLRLSSDRAVVLEVALVRMAQAASLPTLADLLAEVRAGGLGAGGATAGATAGAAAPQARTGGGGSTGFRPPPPRPAAPSAPSASSPPAPRPASGGGDLRSRLMQRLADRVLLQGTVEKCRVDGPDGSGVVRLTLESDRKMYADRLASPVVQQELATAVQELVQQPVRLEVVLPGAGGAAAPGSAAASKAAAAKAKPGPTVQRALEAFGGRVVQVDPPDRVQNPPPKPAEPDDEAPPDPVHEEPPEN